MENGSAGALLRELVELEGTLFAVSHGGVELQFDPHGPSANGGVRAEGNVVRLGGASWNAAVDLRDVSYVALTEEGGVGATRRSVVFADTAGETLLRAVPPLPHAWEAVRERWADQAGVRSVLVRQARHVGDRPAFLKTLGEITEEMRASGRINFVLAVGSSVFEVFPPTVLDRLSVGEGYMTLANDGIHIHVNFARVETLRFCEEYGGVSGKGLPLSLSVKFCAPGGRTLLKAIFPFPHLDDEFKPCDVQPERIEFFRRTYDRYAGRPGVETLVASESAAPLPAEQITGALVAV